MYPPYNKCCNESNGCTNPYDYTWYCSNVSITSVVLGFVLIVGTIISTLPQSIKLIIRKNTIGVSFHWLFIASFSQWSSLINVYVANISKMLGATQSYKTCWSSFVSFYQECVLFGCYQLSTILFLIYEYKGQPIQSERSEEKALITSIKDETQTQKQVNKGPLIQYLCFLTFMLSAGIPMIVCGIYFGSCNKILKGFAFSFGVFSSACVCVEWIPQIIKTLKHKDPGSFSVLGLSLQCPGCLGCLLVSILQRNPWYTWLTWISSFILEFMLLVIIIKLHCEKRKANKIYTVNQQKTESSENLLAQQVQSITEEDKAKEVQKSNKQQADKMQKTISFQYVDQECSDSFS